MDGTAGADIVAWGAKDGNNFCLVSSGTGAAVRLSTQDLRETGHDCDSADYKLPVHRTPWR